VRLDVDEIDEHVYMLRYATGYWMRKKKILGDDVDTAAKYNSNSRAWDLI
jgi:hypothetical protein